MHQPPIHQPMEAVHADDRAWETLRWPGQWSKMLDGRFNMKERRAIAEENVER